MAFIRTSKTRVKVQRELAGNRRSSVRHTIMSDAIKSATNIRNNPSQKSDQAEVEAWRSKSVDERTRVVMDDMKKNLHKEAREAGKQANSKAIDSFVSKAAERADKTRK